MKLYHIDRNNTLHSGQKLELQNDIYFPDRNCQKQVDLVLSYYKEGISNHGISYLLLNPLKNNRVMELSNVMEIILEYERMLNYSDKLSRYQSFFAFDKNGVKQFIDLKGLDKSAISIYEVESEYYEKHNMNLISGDTNYNITAMSKLYWENKTDPYNRSVLYEYLLKFPINIIKKVKLEDLESE